MRFIEISPSAVSLVSFPCFSAQKSERRAWAGTPEAGWASGQVYLTLESDPSVAGVAVDLGSLLTGCVIWGTLFNLSVPWFPYP